MHFGPELDVQNFFINVAEAQFSNTLSDADSERWSAIFDKLNLFFTVLFTTELLVNMFVHWFSAFWSYG